MRQTYYWLVIGLLFFSHWSAAQNIFLQNASFEGQPQDATVPVGWHPCALGTTPDILPGPWGVFQEPSDGDTFVGLITREDGTYESIGQRLAQTLSRRECYSLTLDLAHSQTYSGYNQPVRVRIWGGRVKCAKDQLIVRTDYIKHTDWETYEFQFYAKNPINYIIIEAFYNDGGGANKGNILIDNIRPIKKCIRASLD